MVMLIIKQNKTLAISFNYPSLLGNGNSVFLIQIWQNCFLTFNVLSYDLHINCFYLFKKIYRPSHVILRIIQEKSLRNFKDLNGVLILDLKITCNN